MGKKKPITFDVIKDAIEATLNDWPIHYVDLKNIQVCFPNSSKTSFSIDFQFDSSDACRSVYHSGDHITVQDAIYHALLEMGCAKYKVKGVSVGVSLFTPDKASSTDIRVLEIEKRKDGNLTLKQ